MSSFFRHFGKSSARFCFVIWLSVSNIHPPNEALQIIVKRKDGKKKELSVPVVVSDDNGSAKWSEPFVLDATMYKEKDKETERDKSKDKDNSVDTHKIAVWDKKIFTFHLSKTGKKKALLSPSSSALTNDLQLNVDVDLALFLPSARSNALTVSNGVNNAQIKQTKTFYFADQSSNAKKDKKTVSKEDGSVLSATARRDSANSDRGPALTLTVECRELKGQLMSEEWNSAADTRNGDVADSHSPPSNESSGGGTGTGGLSATYSSASFKVNVIGVNHPNAHVANSNISHRRGPSLPFLASNQLPMTMNDPHSRETSLNKRTNTGSGSAGVSAESSPAHGARKRASLSGGKNRFFGASSGVGLIGTLLTPNAQQVVDGTPQSPLSPEHDLLASFATGADDDDADDEEAKQKPKAPNAATSEHTLAHGPQQQFSGTTQASGDSQTVQQLSRLPSNSSSASSSADIISPTTPLPAAQDHIAIHGSVANNGNGADAHLSPLQTPAAHGRCHKREAERNLDVHVEASPAVSAPAAASVESGSASDAINDHSRRIPLSAPPKCVGSGAEAIPSVLRDSVSVSVQEMSMPPQRLSVVAFAANAASSENDIGVQDVVATFASELQRKRESSLGDLSLLATDLSDGLGDSDDHQAKKALCKHKRSISIYSRNQTKKGKEKEKDKDKENLVKDNKKDSGASGILSGLFNKDKRSSVNDDVLTTTSGATHRGSTTSRQPSATHLPLAQVKLETHSLSAMNTPHVHPHNISPLNEMNVSPQPGSSPPVLAATPPSAQQDDTENGAKKDGGSGPGSRRTSLSLNIPFTDSPPIRVLRQQPPGNQLLSSAPRGPLGSALQQHRLSTTLAMYHVRQYSQPNQLFAAAGAAGISGSGGESTPPSLVSVNPKSQEAVIESATGSVLHSPSALRSPANTQLQHNRTTSRAFFPAPTSEKSIAPPQTQPQQLQHSTNPFDSPRSSSSVSSEGSGRRRNSLGPGSGATTSRKTFSTMPANFHSLLSAEKERVIGAEKEPIEELTLSSGPASAVSTATTLGSTASSPSAPLPLSSSNVATAMSLGGSSSTSSLASFAPVLSPSSGGHRPSCPVIDLHVKNSSQVLEYRRARSRSNYNTPSTTDFNVALIANDTNSAANTHRQDKEKEKELQQQQSQPLVNTAEKKPFNFSRAQSLGIPSSLTPSSASASALKGIALGGSSLFSSAITKLSPRDMSGGPNNNLHSPHHRAALSAYTTSNPVSSTSSVSSASLLSPSASGLPEETKRHNNNSSGSSGASSARLLFDEDEAPGDADGGDEEIYQDSF